MRRRWPQLAATAVAVALALVVVLLGSQAYGGAVPTATARPATAVAAGVSAMPPAATVTPRPQATAPAAAPPTASRTAARPTNTRIPPTPAPPTPTPDGKLPTVAFAQLPTEAQETIRLIDQGGPFPYDRDGITFGNRERLLPSQPDGYYREYTVITPGSADRGARRVVAGQRGELYYTDDHYESFRRVVR